VSGRGRPLSLAAFVARSAPLLDQARASATPDRHAIVFHPAELGAEEAREIDPREVQLKNPLPGRYVFVERVRQADGATAEIDLYECRVTRDDTRDEPNGGRPSMLDIRASMDAAIVAQRGVSEQWRAVAEVEQRRATQLHDQLLATVRERDARETALRDELATWRDRAHKAEAAAAGWKPDQVAALVPLVDRAISLYQSSHEEKAVLRLLDRLPEDLRDAVLDHLETSRRKGAG